MTAVLPRVFRKRRRGRRRPAHAMPSSKRPRRTGIRNPEDRASHARVRIAESVSASSEQAEIQTPGAPELGTAPPPDSSVRHRDVRSVGTTVFKVALISCLCLVIAGVLCVTAHVRPIDQFRHPADRPPVRGTSLPPGRPTAAVLNPPGPLLDAGNQLPGASAPQTGHVTSIPSEGPGHDLSLDVQGLPAASEDPDLEAALGDLDRQAALDNSMREQHGPGEPPGPTAGPPVDVPDGNRPAPNDQ